MGLLQKLDCADANTFQQLYRRLGPAALGKTKRLVGRPEVAQEIVHEVFLGLWQRPIVFPTEQSAYFWVYTACHRRSIDHMRRHASRLVADGAQAIVDSSDNGEASEFAIQRYFIAQVIGHLGNREAEILGLLAIDELTYGEISQLLGLSKKTIQRSVEKIGMTVKKIMNRPLPACSQGERP